MFITIKKIIILHLFLGVTPWHTRGYAPGVYSFLHHPNLSKTEKCVIQVILLTLLSCYKLNRCYIKLSLVNILEMVFVFIEILFKILLFKGGVLIYAEHCILNITDYSLLLL